MPSFYRHQLEKYLKDLDVIADTVLDIGGMQKPVKGRTRSWDVQDYRVLDLPEFDLQENSYRDGRGADIIFCLEVFEYLIRPLDAMKNIAASLRSGGRAYVTFPLVYPVHNEIDRDSLRYTETGIRRLAKEAGLKVAKIHYRYHVNRNLRSIYAQDGMKMAQGVDHEVTGYIVELAK